MQLFICNQIEAKGTEIQITDNSELVNQLRKVLRAKPWYKFFIQDRTWTKRYNVELTSFIEKWVIVKVLWIEEKPRESKKLWMLIALPNKQEKLELIIQKITEIWVTDIFLWSAERSQIKTINDNKLARIEKIIKEAVEQSRWWNFPKIEIIKDIKELWKDRNFMVFDLPKEQENNWKLNNNLPFLWVIGPEWWLSTKDYENFSINYTVQSLWNSVLRMETAAIVWARYLKNYK